MKEIINAEGLNNAVKAFKTAFDICEKNGILIEFSENELLMACTEGDGDSIFSGVSYNWTAETAAIPAHDENHKDIGHFLIVRISPN